MSRLAEVGPGPMRSPSWRASEADVAAVVAHGEIDVREFGLPRQADEAEFLAGVDAFADMDGHAAFAHMGILRRPTVAVVDHHPIARLAPVNGRDTDDGYADVVHAVAHCADNAVGGREDGVAAIHFHIVEEAKIGAV